MSADAFSLPQPMGQILLLSMEEVIGKSGLDAVLRRAALDDLIQTPPHPTPQRILPFDSVSRLQTALEQQYGIRAGQGFSQRIGRACFNYGLKEYGDQLGVISMEFRLLPLPAKLRAGLQKLAELFNDHTDQTVRVEETETSLLWHVERCPLCWGRQANENSCHLSLGLFQEALYWLSGGKTFQVEETACLARGDASCTLKIEKTPLA
jgi:predicted hydrocarbon binding protein